MSGFCILLGSLAEQFVTFQSEFGRNLSGGSIEIGDFSAEVNSRGPLNFSVFTRQVQLGRSTTSEGISVSSHAWPIISTVLRLDSTVNTLVAATSNKLTSVVI